MVWGSPTILLLSAAPSLLLLANRPAFAANCSISGFMSASVGTSLTTHDGSLCNGWSPGNWKNNNGKIDDWAWDRAVVSRQQTFSSLFDTANMVGVSGIREITNGLPGEFIRYKSGIDHSMQQALEGFFQKGSNANNTLKHAAATYLNAAFLANGGGGTAPDLWMVDYISTTDVVGFYLLCEIMHFSNFLVPQGTTCRYERDGMVIAESQNMTQTSYTSFFESMSDGQGSNAWQNG